MLTSLRVHNYKSLRNVQLENLPAFCVLVGANASGKSNFADALDFISLTFRGGLPYAVRTKGGYENICFRRERRSKAAIEFEIKAVDEVVPRRRSRKDRDTDIEGPFQYSYSFAFQATTEAIAADYRVTRERLDVCPRSSPKKVLTMVRNGTSAKASGNVEVARSLGLPSLDYLNRWLAEPDVPLDDLTVPFRMLGFYPGGLTHLLSGCRIYQIAPHMARQTGVPERSPELGRHGENLPAAVDFLRRNAPRAFEELLAHLKHTVPVMEKMETAYVETKQLGLFFSERGVGRRWFSQDVSDGTLQTVSLFLPLLDPRVRIIVIEEPENSLHPWILRHFVETCRSRSEEKQIFLTTHSPVAVNATPLESLFIVSRAGGGTTIIPGERASPEARQVISEHLLGLGDYWDTGAFAGVPEPLVED
jgi:predicted ATPase